MYSARDSLEEAMDAFDRFLASGERSDVFSGFGQPSRDSNVGQLDAALDEAAAKGWTVVDVARDWARVWPD